MYIGVLTLHLSIEGADSLKDKRQVIRSLVSHVRNKFNVSVAEVGELGIWRRATVGVSIVSNEAKYTNQVLSQVVNHVENDWRVVLDDYAIELMQSGGTESNVPNELPNVDEWFLNQPQGPSFGNRA